MPFDILTLPYLDATKFAFRSFRAYVEQNRIFTTITDALRTSNKLAPSMRLRLSEDFKSNARLRGSIVRANDEGEVIEIVSAYDTPRLPYASVAKDIASIYTQQKIDLYPNYVAKHTLYMVKQQSDQLAQDRSFIDKLNTDLESLKIHEAAIAFGDYAAVRVKTDPFGASADFATAALRDKGVKSFTVSVPEGQFEIEYQLSTMQIKAKGRTAQKLQQMVADHEAGRLFHVVLEGSEDFDFSVNEYGVHTVIGERPERLEFYTAPVQTVRQLQFKLEDATYTVNTRIEVDQIHRITILFPNTDDEHINIKLTFDENTRRATITVNMKLAEARPKSEHLPLLRFLSALPFSENFIIVDAESELQVWTFPLTEFADDKQIIDIADYAEFARDFVEADMWLGIKGLSKERLEWPVKSDYGHELRGLLRRIVRVLKDKKELGFMKASSEFTDISEEAQKIDITGGIAHKQSIMVTGPVVLNDKYVCHERVVFMEPGIIVSQGGELILCKTLGEAFADNNGPIKIEFSHEQAQTTYFIPNELDSDNTSEV